jgi:tetratricopeptide (TPR) repeat protein
MSHINNQCNLIADLVAKRRVKQSLDQLNKIIEQTGKADFREEIEEITLTYKNMLLYTIEGVEDPEREKIYNRLLISILTLTDRAKQDILSQQSGWHTYWIKEQMEREQKLSGKAVVESVSDLTFYPEIVKHLNRTEKNAPVHGTDEAKTHQKLLRNLFNRLWLKDYYGDTEKELISLISKESSFDWYERSLFVSAITLSCLRVFQPAKTEMLFNLCSDRSDHIKGRALAGVILVLHRHNRILSLYPEINEKLSQAGNEERFKEQCRIIALQLLRSRETEKVGKKLTEEILPQVAKLQPKIEEKLDLDNILPKDISDDKNPDWSEFFSESEEIYKSFEELSKLQMEGADVYMQAFANLKHFDFFKDFLNWFLPFYPDHEVVDEIFRDEILGPGTNELAEALHKTPFICNSDKYSLLLNLKHLPPQQKSMMLKVFRMELEGLAQMEDGEIVTDPYRDFRISITQYLQDLYRFFKISPYRKEFEDIFDSRLDIYNTDFYRNFCSTPEADLSMGDYLFNKDFYPEALDIYAARIKSEPSNVQLYEKMGYCHQQLGSYSKALVEYRKAELIERRVWNIKKIGLCLRKLEKHEEALDYYLQASDLEPENTHTTIMIAHCYLDIKDYENALKYYFIVEYNQPGNERIIRPIAWCYFALGKFEESKRYYSRMDSSQTTYHDFINMGHLALCMGERSKAVEFYKRGISAEGMKGTGFINTMKYDEDLLLKHGVNPSDIPIITDYLLFSEED